MALFKCKMCGGDLEIVEGASIAECEYCGTKQTVPKAIDENLQNLYNRANTLRIKSEFDKAEKLYEKIIQADSTQSEAYWGLILCKYGIEYVDDPATFKKVPTCHRASFESIVADDDYKSALENADMSQRAIYEEQAKEIDRIQKDILALAQKEENYDVFICYKETGADGRRTQDSVIANDIYYQLTQEGFKVFYAAITLEGKLGSAYEPIIFAALNSAKVMLAIGTKPEYFNAVWVKNEWSRYLKIIKSDRSKLLIPCYRDMDAYELPEEFAHLQAQDMSKIGFINDVVRGIKKVIVKEEPKPTVVKETVVKETVVNTSTNATTAPLLKRVFMFLEDGKWSDADEYCEKVLDIDPECADAYLGKLMARVRANKKSKLATCNRLLDVLDEYNKIIRFADDALKDEIIGYANQIKNQRELAKLASQYENIVKDMSSASTEEDYKSLAERFAEIGTYSDALKLSQECSKKAEEIITAKVEAVKQAEADKKSAIYQRACWLKNQDTIFDLESAIEAFKKVLDWKDSKELIYTCEKRLKEKTANYTPNLKQIRERYAPAQKLLSGGSYFSAGLFPNGTVSLITPDQKLECDWRGVVAVASTQEDCLALKADGTVISNYGDLEEDENIDWTIKKSEEWKDIVAVSGGLFHAIGLKQDGTVVTVGEGASDVSSWKDIIAIAGGDYFTVGLTSKGTVVIASEQSDSDEIFGEVSQWKDIVAISAGLEHILGLKADGTVVAAGSNEHGQCNVSSWENIIAIGGGEAHSLGLTIAGTVVATKHIGKQTWYYGQCEVSSMEDIIAIATGPNCRCSNGIKSDGTVVSIGAASSGERYNLSNWKLFDTCRRNKAETAKFKKEWQNAGKCRHCGGTFTGLFTKKCAACNNKKDY